MTQQPIYQAKGEDPLFTQAVAAAQASFKFFYRELSWERRRIVPALDMAAVKVSFAVETSDPATPSVENMWVSDVGFDGQTLSGVLLNEPHWVRSLKAGDPVRVPLADLNDWMFVCGGRVFGGFTVDALRSEMSMQERIEHDQAWGLDFGEPGTVELAMSGEGEAPLRFTRSLDSAADHTALACLERSEHPMSVNVRNSIEQELAKNPAQVMQPDDEGWQLIHHDALAGNHEVVSVLLRHGADPQAPTPQGQTPVSLARQAGWPAMVELLEHAATHRGIPLWPIGLGILAVALAGLYYLIALPVQAARSGLPALAAGPMPFVLCFLLLGMGLVASTGPWYLRLRLRTPLWGKSRALDVLTVLAGVLLAFVFQQQFAAYLSSL